MGKNNGETQKYFKEGVEEVFPKVAEALRKVCVLARKVFKKRKEIKFAIFIVLYVLCPKVRCILDILRYFSATLIFQFYPNIY